MFCVAAVPRAVSVFLPKAVLAEENRLCHRKDFKRVYKKGKSLANHYFVLYWRKTGAEHYRVGFSISKKLGKAVQRNRLKRQLRAAAKELAPFFHDGYDYIIVVRIAAQNAEYRQLYKYMHKLLLSSQV